MTLTDFLFKRIRRQASPPEVFVVQLHRMTPDPDAPSGVRIGSSWGAMECVGYEAATALSRRLYSDNRWGSADNWPEVTVTRKAVVS